MLRFRQKSSDRRQGYSFPRHLSRLKQEGRLPQIGLAAMALVIAGGLTFGRCQGDSITGPSTATEARPQTMLASSATGSLAPATVPTFRENTVDRNAVFVGVNPCNGEPVVARGSRHDRISATVTAAGNFEADHHINDSFKSVATDAQGVEVADPEAEYVGGDVHNDRLSVDFVEGVTSHRELTNERLSRRGGGDHWVLHMDQRSEFRADDPLNPTVSIKGHASCPPTSQCRLPDGCPDQAFSLMSLSP